MKKLKIVKAICDETKKEINVLTVDDEIFDWGMEPDSVISAQDMQRNHPQFIETIMKTVTEHFIDCLGDFVGRKITLKEFHEAIERGYLS
jgi:hypothetical protein